MNMEYGLLFIHITVVTYLLKQLLSCITPKRVSTGLSLMNINTTIEKLLSKNKNVGNYLSELALLNFVNQTRHIIDFIRNMSKTIAIP